MPTSPETSQRRVMVVGAAVSVAGVRPTVMVVEASSSQVRSVRIRIVTDVASRHAVSVSTSDAAKTARDRGSCASIASGA